MSNLPSKKVDDAYLEWERDAQFVVGKIFDKDSTQLKKLNGIGFGPSVWLGGETPEFLAKFFEYGRQETTNLLEKMILDVKKYWGDEKFDFDLSLTTMPHRKQLFTNLMAGFDLSELRSLSFVLGIDFDDLGGEGKSYKVRGLILWCERTSRIKDLISEAHVARPKLNW